MCTLKLTSAAHTADLQPHTYLVCPPLLEHRPAFDWAPIAQVTPVPEPAGSGSLTVTPFAVPVPALLTVTGTATGSPAPPDAASAVLVITFFFLMMRRPPRSALFPSPPLSGSAVLS